MWIRKDENNLLANHRRTWGGFTPNQKFPRSPRNSQNQYKQSTLIVHKYR